MTRPESDGETPGWRIRRAKPSPTGPLLILVVLAALIAGGIGYVIGSSGKDDGAKEVVAPPTTAPRVATPLNIPVPSQLQPTVTPTLAPPLLPATATPNAILLAPAPGGTTTAGSPGPSTTGTPGTPVPAGTARAPGTSAPAQDSYTVVSGDSLSLIAEKQNVPGPQRDAWVQALRVLNNIQGDNIQPGQQLRLPPRP